MGPWLGVVQWAEVILHWQGPKSNDLCISWIFPRWNPHDCPNTAGDGEKQIAGDELNEVTKGGNRLSKGRGFVGHNLIQLSPHRPLWEGLIVKMLEGGVHNSFEHESRASNLHGPLKAGPFADLSWVVVIIWYALGSINITFKQLIRNFMQFSPSLVISWGSSNTRIKMWRAASRPSFHQGGHAIIVYTGGEDLQSAANARSGCVGTLSDVTWRLFEIQNCYRNHHGIALKCFEHLAVSS